MLFALLSGCTTIINSFDATWLDDQTVYNKSQPLPPFEIPLELSKTEN